MENDDKIVSKDSSPFVQFDTSTGKWTRVPEGKEYNPNQIEKEMGDIAQGVVLPRGSKTPMKYLKNARDYNQRDAGIHEQIKLSDQMYMWEGLVGTTIDLFIDFSITDFSLENVEKDSRERALLEHVIKNVNKENNNMETGMKALLREIMEDYFVAGNVFPFKNKGSITGSEINDPRIRGTKGWIVPKNIYLLNPLQIEIPETKVLIGNKEVWLTIDEEIVSMVRMEPDSEEAEAVLDGLTPAMRSQLKQKGKVKIPDDLVSHIKRRSKGYLTWGRPYLTRAFTAFARKKKLEALDESTIEGLINQVTIFKVGLKDDETWATWTPARQNAFASLLASPNPSNWLVWGPDVEVENVGPDGTILSFDNRYAQADMDILKALGVPTSLISGEGSGSRDRSENVWVAISSLLEKLQTARDQLQIWLEELMFEVLEENRLPTKNRPKIRWTRMNLRNEKEIRDFVTAFFDRGILPIETVVKEAGYDWDVIKDLRAGEKTEKIKGKSYKDVFERRDLPFSGSSQKPPQKPGGNLPKAGRPRNSTKPQTTKTKLTINDKKPVTRVQKSNAFAIAFDEHITEKIDEFTSVEEIYSEFETLSRVFVELVDKSSAVTVKDSLNLIREDFVVGWVALSEIRNLEVKNSVTEELISSVRDQVGKIEGGIEE